MLKILQILCILCGLAYPFVVFFMPEYIKILALILACLFLVRIFLQKDKILKFSDICYMILFGFIAIFDSKKLALFYPILVNILCFIIFFSSLFKEPLITKFAKIKDKNLSQKAIIYTKNLTKIWCYFFVINGGICAILACLENKIFWLYYCGVISYILIFMLLFGEIIYRKIFIKDKDV